MSAVCTHLLRSMSYVSFRSDRVHTAGRAAGTRAAQVHSLPRHFAIRHFGTLVFSAQILRQFLN